MKKDTVKFPEMSYFFIYKKIRSGESFMTNGVPVPTEINDEASLTSLAA